MNSISNLIKSTQTCCYPAAQAKILGQISNAGRKDRKKKSPSSISSKKAYYCMYKQAYVQLECTKASK